MIINYFRLHNLVTGRQQDKTSLGNLERKLLDERKSRTTMEQQLALERKAKKAEEVTAAKAVAMANAYRYELLSVRYESLCLMHTGMSHYV